MSRTRSWGNRRGAIVALLGSALVAAAAAPAASAHAYLVRTVPGNGTTISGGAPRTLTLEFDEAVSGELSLVTVVGAQTGAVEPVRVVQSSASTLTAELPSLARDLYRVAWHTVSEDDLHTTGGTLVFGVDTAVPASSAEGTPTSAPGPSLTEVFLRWEDFAAISVLIGALALLLHGLPAAARRGAGAVERAEQPLRWLGVAGCLAALLSGAGLLLMQVGRAGPSADPIGVVRHTAYGHAWIAREVILLLLVAVLLAMRGSRSGLVKVAAGTLAVALAAPLALVSHAASVRGAASLATALLALHILAAALWVGGVAALCLATVELVRAGERSAARALAVGFAELAVAVVALLVITGIAVLGIHVRSLDALVHTSYGRTLLVKSALFVLAGAAALVTTTSLRWSGAPRRVRAAWSWVPRLELVVLTGVLAAAALLTASAPARDIVARGVQPAGPATVAATSSATADDLLVSVAVEPNRPGANFVTVTVSNTRRPEPAPVDAVALSLGGQGRSDRAIALDPSGADQWQTVTRLRPGRTTVGVTVDRPRLPAARATMAFAVPGRAVPAGARQTPTAPGGFMERPLEPILRPLAIGSAALFLLAFVAYRFRARLGGVARRAARQPTPRGVQP